MHHTREAFVGGATFAAFLASAVAVGQASGSVTLRAVSFLVGLSGGGAMGVFAALAAHLTRGPARYEPIAGAASAWGLAEYDEAGGAPPREQER